MDLKNKDSSQRIGEKGLEEQNMRYGLQPV